MPPILILKNFIHLIWYLITVIIEEINKRTEAKITRGATLGEIKAFYKDLGIDYIDKFETKEHLIRYLDSDVKRGEKAKFALGFIYTIGHVVALKYDKSKGRNLYRIIDFQRSKNDKNRIVKDDLPTDAKAPFYLFKVQVYRFNQ